MTDLKNSITKKDAIRLLTKNNDGFNYSENRFINEFGDYVFPTDYVTPTPNTAVGTSDGLDILEIIRFEENKT